MSRKKMRNRFSGSRIHCGEDGNEDQVSSGHYNLFEKHLFLGNGRFLVFLKKIIFGKNRPLERNEEMEKQRDIATDR